jgi:hypothetical protein
LTALLTSALWRAEGGATQERLLVSGMFP